MCSVCFFCTKKECYDCLADNKTSYIHLSFFADFQPVKSLYTKMLFFLNYFSY